MVLENGEAVEKGASLFRNNNTARLIRVAASKMLDIGTGAVDPSPCHPFPLGPLPGEREEGEGSLGEGSDQAFFIRFRRAKGPKGAESKIQNAKGHDDKRR
jgi:hypothetical protein